MSEDEYQEPEILEQYEQVLNSLESLREQIRSKSDNRVYNFNPVSTNGTKRVWVRLTPELVEFCDELAENNPISSRELAIGTAVAHSANSPRSLQQFIYEEIGGPNISSENKEDTDSVQDTPESSNSSTQSTQQVQEPPYMDEDLNVPYTPEHEHDTQDEQNARQEGPGGF